MMKIILKKYIDESRLSLEKVDAKTMINYQDLQEMYEKGSFNPDKINVNNLTELLLLFKIDSMSV